jgi:hypothetical protein
MTKRQETKDGAQERLIVIWDKLLFQLITEMF